MLPARYTSFFCWKHRYTLLQGSTAAGLVRFDSQAALEKAGSDALEAVTALFQQRKYASCLLLLSAAEHTPLPGATSQLFKAQTLICRIHLHAERGAWWQVRKSGLGSCQAKLQVSTVRSCKFKLCAHVHLRVLT